jgi:hypothetical protein
VQSHMMGKQPYCVSTLFDSASVFTTANSFA